MKLVPTLEAEGHKNLPNGDFDDTRFSPSFFGGGGGGGGGINLQLPESMVLK